jgi:hypothetical protein
LPDRSTPSPSPLQEYYSEPKITQAYEKVLADVLEEVFKLTHGGKALAGDGGDAQVQWEPDAGAG